MRIGGLKVGNFKISWIVDSYSLSTIYVKYAYLAIKDYIHVNKLPIDVFSVMKHIPRDRRHLSKPDTATLFLAKQPGGLVWILTILFLFILVLLCTLGLDEIQRFRNR